MFSNAKQRAKKRGVPFLITKEDIEKVWPSDNRCPILGTTFVVHRGLPSDDSPSLDAMVPALGYVPGNIHVISHGANILKRNVTDPAVFERLAAWMRAHA